MPAHYYSFDFEPNPDWQYRFARGGEIRDYLQHVTDKYGLREHIRFGGEVEHGRHDGERWQLRASNGETHTADVIVAATGVLHHPYTPDLPGLEDFAGPCFHSARWDHTVDLEGKRVGVIGIGSTGVQIITELGGRGHELVSFQRTPQWIFPMPDRSYTALERGLMRRFPWLSTISHRAFEWAFEQVMAKAVIKPGWQRRLLEKVMHWHLARIKDPALRAQVTPPDHPMCKRLVMSGRYFDVLQKDNVGVVTEDIERIEPEGVRTTDGTLHEVDVLVLATGFHAHDYMRPMELETRDGRTLSESWADKTSAKAYRTIALPGFPNFFMVQGPMSPIGNFSLISIAQTQTDYIMQCIRLLRDNKVDSLVPRPEVAQRLEKELVDSMSGTVWMSGCNSWYLDADGNPDSWPSTPARFRQYLKSPRLDEYEQFG